MVDLPSDLHFYAGAASSSSDQSRGAADTVVLAIGPSAAQFNRPENPKIIIRHAYDVNAAVK